MDLSFFCKPGCKYSTAQHGLKFQAEGLKDEKLKYVQASSTQANLGISCFVDGRGGAGFASCNAWPAATIWQQSVVDCKYCRCALFPVLQHFSSGTSAGADLGRRFCSKRWILDSLGTTELVQRSGLPIASDSRRDCMGTQGAEISWHFRG